MSFSFIQVNELLYLSELNKTKLDVLSAVFLALCEANGFCILGAFPSKGDLKLALIVLSDLVLTFSSGGLGEA